MTANLPPTNPMPWHPGHCPLTPAQGHQRAHGHAAQMAVSRSLWHQANDHRRAEFLDTCRLRFAAHVRKDRGVELTDDQIAGVIVVVADPREPTPAPTVTVTLHGGPLDGSTAPSTRPTTSRGPRSSARAAPTQEAAACTPPPPLAGGVAARRALERVFKGC